MVEGDLVSWDFCVVETFTAITIEEDGFIAKDTADEFIHFRFFEFAAVLRAIAAETCRSSNLILEKVANVSTVRRDASYIGGAHQASRLLHRACVQGYIDNGRFGRCMRFDSHHAWHLLEVNTTKPR
jgi:hypothetical protein